MIYFSFYFFLICLFFSYAMGVTVGSNTAVAIQLATTFPNTDSNNKMLGFSRFSSGFTLQDGTTSCTFDSIFPVSGPVSLNGGNLYLTQDLVCNNNFQFNSLGSIWGGGYSIEISTTNAPLVIPTLSSSTILLDTAKVILGCPVYLRTVINTRNSCVISGRGNELRLLSGGSITVNPHATLILEDLYLTGVSGSNIQCNYSDSNLILRNCVLELSSNYTFSLGSINFDQNVYVTGPSSNFIYTSVQTSQINTNATLYFETGTTFQYVPAAANKNLIVMQDSTASLYLDGCTVLSTNTGLRLNTGNLYFHNGVTFTNQANNLAEGIEFGANLSVNFLSKSFVNLYGFYRYGT
jgi:hypothetical protein